MKKLELKCTSFSHKLCKYNSYKGTIGKIANNKINRRFIPLKKAYLDPFLDMFNGEIFTQIKVGLIK